jgi:hypothetical protein
MKKSENGSRLLSLSDDALSCAWNEALLACSRERVNGMVDTY